MLGPSNGLSMASHRRAARFLRHRSSPARPLMNIVRLRIPLTRLVLLVGLVIGLVVLARSDALHAALLGVLDASKDIIVAHPVAGPMVFIAAAAVSAMAGFVSSAVLVPAAVYAWGAPITILMLWLGWFLGGLTAFTLAYHLGRPVLRLLIPAATLGRYQSLLDKTPRFSSVLLFQLALPSEIPGYLLGLARYSLPRYLAALALAELPWAVGTVLLGVGFVNRDQTMLIVVSAIGLIAMLLITRAFRRHTEARRASSHGASE